MWIVFFRLSLCRARALDGDLPRLSGPVLKWLCAPTMKSRLADPSLSRRCKSWILDHTLRAEEAETVDRASWKVGKWASWRRNASVGLWNFSPEEFSPPARQPGIQSSDSHSDES